MFIRLRRWIALPVHAAVAVILVGCAGPAAESSTVGQFAFSNEEEALTEVSRVVRDFFDTVDLIGADGGVGAHRLRALVSEELYAKEQAGFTSLVDRGWRFLGTTGVAALELTEWRSSPDGSETVAVAVVCVDYAQIDVIDATGASVVSEHRPMRRGAELQVSRPSNRLIISTKATIDEDRACG